MLQCPNTYTSTYYYYPFHFYYFNFFYLFSIFIITINTTINYFILFIIGPLGFLKFGCIAKFVEHDF